MRISSWSLYILGTHYFSQNQAKHNIYISSYITRYMGYKTKVQLIDRKKSKQWYINFPYQVAEVMEFKKGENCEWTLINKKSLKLKRVKK